MELVCLETVCKIEMEGEESKLQECHGNLIIKQTKPTLSL